MKFYDNKNPVTIDFSITSVTYLDSVKRLAGKFIGLDVVVKDGPEVSQAYAINANDITTIRKHYDQIGSLKTNPTADRTKIDINHMFYSEPQTTQ